MGRITGLLYGSIFVLVSSLAFAAATGSLLLTGTLWALAAGILVVLCVLGDRIDGRYSPRDVRELEARPGAGARRSFRRDREGRPSRSRRSRRFAGRRVSASDSAWNRA